ncbi:Glycosyltransferase involved in cell wall bisynthesis [Halpernia humi]|uniref:Glycosyltransferase involved in cell wall bisynthesis n=1 Tax=Halpernia humi TaxID=493375 RepID=A0A1H5UCN4_9FLAO|nr:glycosyltransferase [Halpernia humi]SEF72017.1 Glycosyltransferase involved in cell wall bisynthesis [Halpernia humi]
MKKLLIIGMVWPEPNSTAAGKRMLQLVSLFQKLDFKITFCSTAAKSDHSADLNILNIDSQEILLNDSSFDDLIKNLQPNIVLFDRFTTEEQFGWRVSENCAEAVKILDTEDLHFLRKAREKAYKSKVEISKEDYISDVFKREIASILRCDLSLIISEFEYQLLKNDYQISPKILYYLPMFGEKFKAEILQFNDRKNFFHIGNFLHEPNWQTVLILKNIWAEIREKLPETELHIYGSYAPEKALQLHNEKEGFLVKGRAENVQDLFLNYRVLVAPIAFGAGIKGKLLESMIFGCPNVTTKIGAEGMAFGDFWNGFIAESNQEFIEKSIELYSNEEVWDFSQKKGFEILHKKFNIETFKPDFQVKLKEIITNLAAHRNANFLGQILQHHSLQSTKYMSKWIEEKNRKK